MCSSNNKINTTSSCVSTGRVSDSPDRILYCVIPEAKLSYCTVASCLKKIRTHLDLLSIPQPGGGNVKTFRWDRRLQIQNLFMFKKNLNALSLLIIHVQGKKCLKA